MSKSSMATSQQILTYVIDIKEDVAGIKEHLRTLNGKVADNRERIVGLERDTLANKINWAKLSGIVFGVSIAGSLVGNKLLSVLGWL